MELKKLFIKKQHTQQQTAPKSLIFNMFVILMFIFSLSIILLEFKQITALFYEIVYSIIRFFTLPLYIQRFTLFFIIFITFILSVKLSPTIYIPNLNFTIFYRKKWVEGDLIHFKTFRGYTLITSLETIQRSYLRFTIITPVYLTFEDDIMLLQTAELEVTKDRMITKLLRATQDENVKLRGIIEKKKDEYISLTTLQAMKERPPLEINKQ